VLATAFASASTGLPLSGVANIRHDAASLAKALTAERDAAAAARPPPAAAGGGDDGDVVVDTNTWLMFRLQRMLADYACLAARQEEAAQAVAACSAGAAGSSGGGGGACAAAASSAADGGEALWAPAPAFFDALTSTRALALPPPLCVAEAERAQSVRELPPATSASARVAEPANDDVHARVKCTSLTRGAVKQVEAAWLGLGMYGLLLLTPVAAANVVVVAAATG
jgi:hypothetical protein